MTRFARVDEEGRSSSAGQGRGDLAGDMARLAHTGDHYAPAATEENPARFGETVVDSLAQRRQCRRFDGDDPRRRVAQRAGIDEGWRGSGGPGIGHGG